MVRTVHAAFLPIPREVQPKTLPKPQLICTYIHRIITNYSFAISYHGPGQMLFTEFVGNSLVDSDGIALQDNGGPNGEPECKGFNGPYVRWAVVRRNRLAGISAAARNSTQSGQKPVCGGVSLRAKVNWSSTDVVTEGQMLECPTEGKVLGYSLPNCSHCSVRQ